VYCYLRDDVQEAVLFEQAEKSPHFPIIKLIPSISKIVSGNLACILFSIYFSQNIWILDKPKYFEFLLANITLYFK